MALYDYFSYTQPQITGGSSPTTTVQSTSTALGFSPLPCARSLTIPNVTLAGILIASGNASINSPINVVPILNGGLQVSFTSPTPTNYLWNIGFLASAAALELGILNSTLQYDYPDVFNPARLTNYSNIGMYFFGRGGFVQININNPPALRLTIGDFNGNSASSIASLVSSPPRQLIFPLAPYAAAGVNLSNVKFLQFTFNPAALSAGVLTYYQFGTGDPNIPGLAPDVLCLDSQTEILMADNQDRKSVV